MSGFFTVELDTMGPEISVYAPSYVSKDNYNEITIEANETLGTYQDFYFLDSLKNKHEVIFLKDGTKFIGQVRFNNFAPGIATLYILVKDEVDNPSNLVEIPIEVKANEGYTIIESVQRVTNLSASKRKAAINIDNRSTNIFIKNRNNNLEIEVEQ